MRTTWGTPAKAGGWPTFGKDGKVVREVYGDAGYEVCRSPLAGPLQNCVKRCGMKCEWAVA